MSKARFEIYEDEAGEFRFRLVAPNNEIVAVSEGYDTPTGCRNGVEAVKKYAPDAEIIEK